MFIDELLACFHLFGIHWVGLSHLRHKGFPKVDGMVKRSSWREFPIFWFVEDFRVLSILWGKFLFDFICCLGQGGGESELSDVGMIFS